ncbi:unnamed protein product [Phytophthora fragariaefolia]|uniref:Unnamed protein product n=1 Tax=Phytophthora fragariaefolia TaxID=1490495 RepID=A0A9W6XXG1_9STRA|nr:unnamed protein product [Phytophthora fragariaefolia]
MKWKRIFLRETSLRGHAASVLITRPRQKWEMAPTSHISELDLSGKNVGCMLLLQQVDRLLGLVQRFCSIFGMIGPLTQEQLAALELTTHQIIGNFAISHTATFAHIQQLDLWVSDNVQNLDAGQMDVVLPVVAQIINSRRGQLTHKFDEATLHNIVAEFDELRREYDVSNKFRQAVKESDKPLATFDDTWVVGDAPCKFPSLAEFCGGFAWDHETVLAISSDLPTTMSMAVRTDCLCWPSRRVSGRETGALLSQCTEMTGKLDEGTNVELYKHIVKIVASAGEFDRPLDVGGDQWYRQNRPDKGWGIY